MARNIAKKNGLQAVLDLGCGPATKAVGLLAHVCKRVVGIDQKRIIDICKQRYPNYEFYADNFDAPYLGPIGQFDLVVCADVIEHINNPDSIIDYIRQVAQDGAYLVISTPERDILRGSDCMACPKPEHVREWNREEFACYLASRGLDIVEHRLVPDQRFHFSKKYMQILIKAFRHRRSLKYCQSVVCRVWTNKICLPDCS